MPVALITGASQGLGRAVAVALSSRGWSLVVDARGAGALADVANALPRCLAIAGDVADPGHRVELAHAAAAQGGLDLLVNNASNLGATPLPPLARYPLGELARVYEVDVLAPLALTQLVLAQLREHTGTVVNVSSDAAVEAYAGWGGYGSAKAALDALSAVLAVEEPAVHVYAFDPGDMRTAMHQNAFPDDDISDRPDPDTVVPALLRLIAGELPSGRYRAAELATAVPA